MVKKWKFLSVAISLSFLSCGGGGGGTTTETPSSTTTTSVSGQVLSSYVSGAYVCSPNLDYCSQTDSYGKFSLKLPYPVSSVILALPNGDGYYQVGTVNLPGNYVLITPQVLTEGNTTAAAYLRSLLHSFGGDYNSTAVFLNLNGVEISSVRDSSGNDISNLPLSQVIAQYKTFTVNFSKNGVPYTVKVDETSQTISVCNTQTGSCENVKPATYKWLVLIYMMADNNLSPYSDVNISQLKSVKYNPLVKVVVYRDTYGNNGVEIYSNDDQTGEFKLVKTLPEEDSADPSVLEDFIKNYASQYLSNNIALILWDHGLGWRMLYYPNSDTREAGIDDSSNSTLFMYQINQVLKDLKAGGINISLIGFDECLMGSLEVAYDVSVNARNFVGSEYLEPGYGWNYTKVMSFLNSNPDMDGWAFAKGIVDAYGENYSNNCPDGICTLAAAKISAVLRLVNDTDEVANFYINSGGSYYDQYYNARVASQVINGRYPIADNSVDLYSLADNLQGQGINLNSLNDIKSILQNTDFIYTFSTDPNYRGFSIYFPLSPNDDDGWAKAYYTCTEISPCILNTGERYYNVFAETRWPEFIEMFVNQ